MLPCNLESRRQVGEVQIKLSERPPTYRKEPKGQMYRRTRICSSTGSFTSHLFLPRLPFLFILNTRWSLRHPRRITMVWIQLWQVKRTLWLLGLMNSTIVSHIYFFKPYKTLVLLRKIDLMRRNCSGPKKIKWRTVILKHRRLIMKIWFVEGP